MTRCRLMSSSDSLQRDSWKREMLGLPRSKDGSRRGRDPTPGAGDRSAVSALRARTLRRVSGTRRLRPRGVFRRDRGRPHIETATPSLSDRTTERGKAGARRMLSIRCLAVGVERRHSRHNKRSILEESLPPVGAGRASSPSARRLSSAVGSATMQFPGSAAPAKRQSIRRTQCAQGRSAMISGAGFGGAWPRRPHLAATPWRHRAAAMKLRTGFDSAREFRAVRSAGVIALGR